MPPCVFRRASVRHQSCCVCIHYCVHVRQRTKKYHCLPSVSVAVTFLTALFTQLSSHLFSFILSLYFYLVCTLKKDHFHISLFSTQCNPDFPRIEEMFVQECLSSFALVLIRLPSQGGSWWACNWSAPAAACRATNGSGDERHKGRTLYTPTEGAEKWYLSCWIYLLDIGADPRDSRQS